MSDQRPRPDNSMEHLFPSFRESLIRLLESAQHATGYEWRMEEGYRSQARQNWLTAHSDANPGNINSLIEGSNGHTLGLAADCYPINDGLYWYGAPRSLFQLWRNIYLARGFSNPNWEDGHLGHVQWGTDLIRHQAALWVERGFQ